MEKRGKNATSPMHQRLPRLDWACQEKAFLNLGQPLPTGLEGLEAISSMQKVLRWLEVYVPNDLGPLEKEEEDYENKTDKEDSREILEEDITCPVPSDTWEDSSPSQYLSEEYSDQESFQREEDENKAATVKAVSKLQSISPALAGSMGTKDEPAMSSRHQPEKASGSTPTSTDQAPSTPTWDVLSLPGVQRRAYLLSSQRPGGRSHGPVREQRPSLFRRALRAVCRAFLGTHRPREQEQQRPAPRARQEPGGSCSKPQQRPLRK